jgi:tRNA 2-thiouridine synthesizing protein A
MRDVTTVDARGLSCPEPVLRTRQAIGRLQKGVVEVLVDSGTSRDNVSRLAQRAGWQVAAEPRSDGSFRVLLTK